jgi:hypothetical protein
MVLKCGDVVNATAGPLDLDMLQQQDGVGTAGPESHLPGTSLSARQQDSTCKRNHRSNWYPDRR